MLPQFVKNSTYQLKAEDLAVGITIFAIGLFKKVVLADGIAIYATSVFDAAEQGFILTFFEAWGGALSYTLQLYFDFSGYSDMAIGLARMFGIILPLNFNSPYKATSIIEFWRCWHITLSRFLRNYLYVSLGGNRKGEIRRNINILTTMLLGGLWHGAGWTFVLWGGLHCLYLIINHIWRKLLTPKKPNILSNIFGWIITMIAVVFAWVPFRAESMGGAKQLLGAMVGMNGIHLPLSVEKFGIQKEWLLNHGIILQDVFRFGNFREFTLYLVSLFLIVIIFPNTQQIMNQSILKEYNGEIYRLNHSFLEWKPLKLWAIYTTIILTTSILFLGRFSEFLYFQF